MFYRNISSLFQLAIIVCFLAVLTPAHAGNGQPVAVIEADSYNFGEIYEKTDVIYDFIIKNIGDADLEIQSVRAK